MRGGVLMSILEKIIKLTNAKSTGTSGSFVGSCLIHNDKRPSLSITQDANGKVLVHCHAGCAQNDLIDYFRANDAWTPESTVNNAHDKNSYAKLLWESSLELNGTDIASMYLKNRGLKFTELPKTLRFNPSCYLNKEKNLPALIAKIQDSSGELIGVQRIYLDNSGQKANVDTPKKILGSFKSGYVELRADSPGDEIHITEGIETGLAVFLSLKQTTYCAVSASNLSKVRTAKTDKTTHIWADEDKSGTGEREARKAAQEFTAQGIRAIIHLPNAKLSEHDKSIDWLDIYNIDGQETICDELSMGQVFEPTTFADNPKPIKSPQYDLPKIDATYLPPILCNWVLAHAERLNIAPEMIVVPLLSVIGSLIGRQLVIQPKKYDPWPVYANLWGIIIAPSGTKKSAALGTVISLLNKIEQEAREESTKL